MKVAKADDVTTQEVVMEGAKDCTVQWLVGKGDGAPNFAMRRFEVAPGGHTPRHSHPYEHEIFVLEGAGDVVEGEQLRPIAAGDVLYISPDEIHQFRNSGDAPLKFLCMVPHIPDDAPVTTLPECEAVRR